jgi:hypothetical protein
MRACSGRPVDRPPPDIRDDEEKDEVARILAVLPIEHPARLAHREGGQAPQACETTTSGMSADAQA